jgi:hypothetical protein
MKGFPLGLGTLLMGQPTSCYGKCILVKSLFPDEKIDTLTNRIREILASSGVPR